MPPQPYPFRDPHPITAPSGHISLTDIPHYLIICQPVSALSLTDVFCSYSFFLSCFYHTRVVWTLEFYLLIPCRFYFILLFFILFFPVVSLSDLSVHLILIYSSRELFSIIFFINWCSVKIMVHSQFFFFVLSWLQNSYSNNAIIISLGKCERQHMLLTFNCLIFMYFQVLQLFILIKASLHGHSYCTKVIK